MTLQSSGPISLQHVNVELKQTATAKISLNDAAVRKLLGKTSGTISLNDAYGKSSEIRYVNSIDRTSANIYAIMGGPTEVANYIFENNAEIYGYGNSFALRTGVFPAGSTLTIVNNGYIRGLGGAGSSDVATPGGAGGDALYLEMACQIDNTNGYIIAGGGGGGSAQRVASANSAFYVRAGGGGGAGKAVGVAGVNAHASASVDKTASSTDPKIGTFTAGGAGGTMGVRVDTTWNDIAYGGAGGTNGAAGAKGSTAALAGQSYKNIPTVGTAGAAGRAIVSNGNSLTQIGGFGSDRVIGAIV